MIKITHRLRPKIVTTASLRKSGAVALLTFGLLSPVLAQEMASGIVFHDHNENGRFDAGDRPLANIAVSNGRDIVTTDSNGRFQISREDTEFVFILKPRNWTSPTSDSMLPQFFQRVSAKNRTERLEFPLQPQEEPDSFDVLVFGDTQPRDLQEIYYLANDSIVELQKSPAAFGITLGDVVFDNLNIFEDLNDAIATIGIPWRNILGNHDLDLLKPSDTEARARFFDVYGPSYYSFTYGSAHFIVIDNIQRLSPRKDGSRRYQTGLGPDQFQFLENELNRIGKDQQIFLLAHIPWVRSTPWHDDGERARFFELLAEYPNAVSFASHRHIHSHEKIGNDHGYPGEDPHHLVVMGASCGSWWRGAPDAYGVPHGLMRCGTPTGYGFLKITPDDWKLRYKAAGRPADYQMTVHAPDSVSPGKLAEAAVYANPFNALPNAEVKVRFHSDGEWQPMKIADEVDPFYAAAHERETALADAPFRRMPNKRPSPHLWKLNLPDDLQPGFHVIEVEATDRWDTYSGRRLIHVK